MHVLLTNDDGPPSAEHSPYVHYLVEAIQKYTDWELSIAVPSSQKSWIGKAHIVGHNVTASYIYTNGVNEAIEGPFEDHQPDNKGTEWTLLDGTPASCANIGIHHLYKNKGPIDLVISGPNYGRNSTALYIMSSGTVGASMEAALCGVKSISISYGFDSRMHDPVKITQAARTSVKLSQYLYDNWVDPVQLYSVNIPLCESLSDETRIVYTHILENTWGAAFEIPSEHVEKERPSKFMWRPNFAAVDQTVKDSYPGNDGWVVSNGEISVTPLRAVFKGIDIEGEIKLKLSNENTSDSETNVAVVSTPNTYVKPLWEKVFKEKGIQVFNSREEVGEKNKIVEYGEYDDLDFDRLMMDDGKYLGCSYIYRKALIRKHYLGNTIRMYVAKNPQSILKTAYPESFTIEVDYAEFLDDALDEAYELRGEIESGEKTWILKPSMSDRGQGIRLFNSIEEMQAIFDEFDEGVVTDDEDEDEGKEEEEEGHGVITSQLRHFVVQEYLSNPLLLSNHNNRKFHIRTYVICIGAIKVYVYKEMLALFALSEYTQPKINDDNGIIDLIGHLTNTCLQGESKDEGSVKRFWDLECDSTLKEDIFKQICTISGETFKAASTVDRINFQPLPNAFEIYGLDFLVTTDHSVHLLEVNAYPDFKQTGDQLNDIILNLFRSIYNLSITKFFNQQRSPDTKTELVLDLNLSGAW